MDRKTSIKICRKYGGISLGDSPGKSWLKERFKHPYLRDMLLDNGIMIDTLETATTWNRVEKLYSTTKNSLHQTIGKYGLNSLVLTHISHSYTEGTSLYFTFMSRQKEAEEFEQWLEVKKVAIDTILENAGTLSHHHGVGRDHAPWLEREIGHLGKHIIINLKKQLDPQNILNPSNLTSQQGSLGK
jgi:alkyldihydroxyacetonephosphate synthase